MSTPTLSAPARAISFGAGAIAAGGALFVLWQQPLSTGQWEAAHVLVPIVLALAILAGKLSYVAWRQGVLSSAAGFVVLFGMATAWIVINSVGNQAEVSDHRVAAARAAHARLRTLTSASRGFAVALPKTRPVCRMKSVACVTGAVFRPVAATFAVVCNGRSKPIGRS
jgi:hypothetical protein